MIPWQFNETTCRTPRELVAYYGEQLRDHAALRYEATIYRADADRIEAQWLLSVEGKNAEQRAAALSLALRGDDEWIAANTERGLAELRAALADARAKEALQALDIVKLEIQYTDGETEHLLALLRRAVFDDQGRCVDCCFIGAHAVDCPYVNIH